ncbi:hypothetical protein FEM48_Zijuj11G0101200 [Ziziphus jujuba var. spinosa]|uniref:Uncharacterized protein n=1 Tax=Ziziphus jujuba var. spinosa TaxID=714518 RepID=A0A978UIB8_ZIZJJ|nr:hypothetical protein FEM48_Zijuj11G0101200 [Ziziphus jujuba var. spinosa]
MPANHRAKYKALKFDRKGPKKGMEQPHVIVHPLPVQGHIKPMLCLAQLLSEAGLYTTFLITHHAQKRMANLPALTTQFPNIHFEFISDGFPKDHPRDVNSSFFNDIKIKTKPHFKQFLLSLKKKSENGASPPVTCIIADGYVFYSFEVAEELRLPIFAFVSHGACFLQAYHSIPLLIQQGHLPFRDDNINYQIQCVPGLEGLLTSKNLPPVCLLNLEAENSFFQEHVKDILGMNRSSGVIINTFNDLEVQCLPHVTTHFQKFYTVGPLHAFVNSKIGKDSHLLASHASLWKAEKKCIDWLDSQPLRSVLYVSFGTLARKSISQLLDFWHGLVDSGHRFLWVVRPDVILEEEGENVIIPEQLQTFNRSSVKSTVDTLMGSKREAFQRSVDRIANCAQDGIGHGGSSNHNLEMLVTDIKKIKTEELKVHL